MDQQPEIVDAALQWLDRAGQIAMGWLVSPAAWSQFGLLAAAYLLAVLLSLAAPSLKSLQQKHQMQSQAEQLQDSISFFQISVP